MTKLHIKKQLTVNTQTALGSGDIKPTPMKILWDCSTCSLLEESDV